VLNAATADAHARCIICVHKSAKNLQRANFYFSNDVFERKSESGSSEGRSCDEMTARKVITLQRAMTKNIRHFFRKKGVNRQLLLRVTPSLVTPLQIFQGAN